MRNVRQNYATPMYEGAAPVFLVGGFAMTFVAVPLMVLFGIFYVLIAPVVWLWRTFQRETGVRQRFQDRPSQRLLAVLRRGQQRGFWVEGRE